ncbi:MAG: epoxyqueuosine reductase QueH [Humidesulfovibrio sp.]|uniref:epoxyqueuosine reductase QueH n=1 Tax=Humidesulfovibrio sp. TaxID=2910988 RepID=UPI0027E90DC0|nr:epoxyqueuosine reductase QueH [Humidesulfovibrio sp.]MDQ7836417.1 epoxyqueuosine reductase QueH [Humidesulfovibrio sp.]
MQPRTTSPLAENAILMHSCCGPCSITPIMRLRDMGLEPTIFFYNPNIHPLLEYLKRRESVLAVAARLNVPVLIADEATDPERPAHSGPAAAHAAPWLTAMAELGPGMDDMKLRCPRCYDIRLVVAAAKARSLGFARYTTSLLYSRYQNQKAIIESGLRHSGPGLDFLPEDFRPGLLEGVRLSKEWGIYRQQYCGCLLSEYDRYRRLLEPEAAAAQS